MSLPATTLSDPQSGQAILSKFGKMLLGYQPTLLVGAVLIALPAAWITKVHMGWKPKPDSKKRMLIAQGVFWGSMLLGFKTLHAALFALPDRKVLSPSGKGLLQLFWQLGNAKTRGPAAATLAVITAGLGGFVGSMIGGFEGGIRLSKALVPKQPKTTQPTPVPSFFPYSFSSMPPNPSLHSFDVVSQSDLTTAAILNSPIRTASFLLPPAGSMPKRAYSQPFVAPFLPVPAPPQMKPFLQPWQPMSQTLYRMPERSYPVWRN